MVNNLKRFLHWGPITFFILIICVSWTTLHMNNMLWPPHESLASMANLGIYLVTNMMTLLNFIRAVTAGPGYLPKKWQPKHINEMKFLQICKACDGYKAPRSHHCRRCDRCVKKMDHHCPWINNCVGWGNQLYFINFLLYFALTMLQASVILCLAFYRGLFRRHFIYHGMRHLATIRLNMLNTMLTMFSFGVAIGTIMATGKLVYNQMKSVFTNQTEIEQWIVKKARFRRVLNAKHSRKFLYPYDLGWLLNFNQVFDWNFQQHGDGIVWPVRKGCDQYTLTREQLSQKLDKLARTRRYRCIHPATGHWMPIWSQGLLTGICIPFTDDPRICLEPNDLVHVTRIQDYWLYGERVQQPNEKEHRKGPKRGWLPSRCVIEVTDSDESAGGDGDGD
ncbi:palmitoyltransferase ZDHHC6 [Drosophila tropicalis]|uniref:palmitoyltransferase ZDHHC6 n=1 Tax=Drosophila tropicalis TaxID=46794 RepID=UPI0035ABBF50